MVIITTCPNCHKFNRNFRRWWILLDWYFTPEGARPVRPIHCKGCEHEYIPKFELSKWVDSEVYDSIPEELFATPLEKGSAWTAEETKKK